MASGEDGVLCGAYGFPLTPGGRYLREEVGDDGVFNVCGPSSTCSCVSEILVPALWLGVGRMSPRRSSSSELASSSSLSAAI